MKRTLPEIAIHAKSWKEGMKIAVDFLRSQGEVVIKRKEEKVNANFNTLLNGYKTKNTVGYNWEYLEPEDGFSPNFINLTMPEDFEKLKSYFENEPKDGGVYVIDKWVFRSTGNPNTEYYTQLDVEDDDFEKHSKGDGFTVHICSPSFVEATPEEEAKLIKAEHENGYYWNGDDLLRIPEYIEYTRRENHNSMYNLTVGKIYKVNHSFIGNGLLWFVINDDNNVNFYIGNPLKGRYFDYKPSTKEAFIAQNKPTYEDLEKENSQLKDKINKLKEIISH